MKDKMQKINEVYKKVERKETVIQFGEGGFLRAFCDWMIDAMNKKGKLTISTKMETLLEPYHFGAETIEAGTFVAILGSIS